MALSVGLDVAVTALRAQQVGVDVTSHNIANANTPGFTRQEARMAALIASGGVLDGHGSVKPGRGVEAIDIARIRDAFVDFRLRETFQTLGRFQAESEALAQAEVIFREPGEGSLSAQFSRFWNAWRELANTPESTTARATLLADAEALVTQLQWAQDALRGLQRDVDGQIQAVVTRVNGLATEIAALNTEIMKVEATGRTASDLRDRRDLRLDEIAQLGNVAITEVAGGAVNVVLGGRQIVSGNIAERLITTVNPANFNYVDVRFETDNSLVNLTSGELFGLVNARDTGLAKPIADLNTLAGALITQVNAVHTTAFGLDNTTGEAFFTGTDAASIGANAVLAADANKIGAASAANLPGDASKALAMADLENALVMNGGAATLGEFYAGAVSALGVAIQGARAAAENEEFLAQHLRTMRESVAGVSLDEELANLIKFQRAFEAAARLISVIDSMLDTLINRTGVVGR